MVLCVAVRIMLFRGLGTLLGQESQPLVPDNLCATCFLEGTRFPLQCAPLSDHPSFHASVKIRRACLVGVMVDLEVHCFPPATILDEDAKILGWR